MSFSGPTFTAASRQHTAPTKGAPAVLRPQNLRQPRMIRRKHPKCQRIEIRPGSSDLTRHFGSVPLLLLALCLAAGLSLRLVESVHAQDSQPPHSSPLTEPNSRQNPARESTATPLPQTKAEEQAVKSGGGKKEKDARGSILIAPLPLVSPAIGSGIIPVVAYIFPFSKNDEVSPPSTVGAAGLITNNGTRAFALGAQLFLKQNTYEVTGGYVRGNLNYDLYGVGIVAGKAGLKLPLEQTGHGYFAEALRRIAWGVFVGPRFLAGDSFLTVRPSGGEVPPPPPDLGINTTLRALGFRIVRDTRSNHFYPLNESKVEFTLISSLKPWAASTRSNVTNSSMTSSSVSARTKSSLTTCMYVTQVASPLSMRTAFMGRPPSCGGTRPEDTSIVRCSRHNWSIVFRCRRDLASPDSQASAKYIPVRVKSSEAINSCRQSAEGRGSCSVPSTM